MSVTKCVRIKSGKRKIYYRAQVYVSGVRVAGQVFETQSAAHAWHDKEKQKTEDGVIEEKEISRELTFDECLSKYLDEFVSKQELSSQEAKMPRIPYLRKCPLSNVKMINLRASTIDVWITWLLKQSTAKNIKRKSFIPELKILSGILHWYRDYIDAGFVVQITKRHREMARYKRVKPRRPDYYAKPEEVRHWIEWLRNHRNPVYFQLASFLMLTGARVGEGAGLCWKEVDLVNGTARIVRIVSWEQSTKHPRLEERTKTDGSVRSLVLPAVLVSLLKEMRRVSSDDDLVFKSRKGGMLKYNAIQSAFNAGFKALELPWRSTHICRHTYATLALMATRDLGGVQASLGHKTQAMTEKYAKNIALLQSGTAEKTAALIRLGEVE